MDSVIRDESARREAFPICRDKVFLAHAGVTALPRCVADAMIGYINQSCEAPQEFAEILTHIEDTRRSAARLIGASPDEIALLGPTSLGLSLFALGLPWEAGDEILCYADDYPANVYPWIDLRRRGVEVTYLQPERPGEITPELVAAALSPRTKLVALASCHFFCGYRIDVDAIGRLLRERGVLFSLDAIQTLGAFPTSVEFVDFLSADSHKWLLGPMSAGIVYVKKSRFDLLRPALLGAWNVKSPHFIAQDSIALPDHARRYEPGVLNTAGIYGMKAAIDMLLELGIPRAASRILELKAHLVNALLARDFEITGPIEGEKASGITTFRHPRESSLTLFQRLEEKKVIASHRFDRAGRDYIRISPHFYNTIEELDRTIEALAV